MSSFSRGCLLRHQLPMRLVQPLPTIPKSYHLRNFSASILRAAKPARKSAAIKPSLTKNKPSQKSSESLPNKTFVHQSFAATLAQKSHPTPLYEAPSHTLFMATSYGGAFFFLVYGGYAGFCYFDAPPGIPVYVPYAFGVAGFMMAAFAGWLTLGPAKIIRSITAVPKRLLSAGMSPAIIPRSTLPASATELELEVELRKMFPTPFFPARKIYCQPRELVVTESIAPPAPVPLNQSQLRTMKLEGEKERQRQLEYERNHILTSRMRHRRKIFSQLFKSMKQAWTREGFSRIQIKGQFYKLDTTGGWALDNGKALARLATIKRGA